MQSKPHLTSSKERIPKNWDDVEEILAIFIKFLGEAGALRGHRISGLISV